jgi:hypothetical protein
VNAVTRGAQLLARRTCIAVSTTAGFAVKIFADASLSDCDVPFYVIFIKLLGFCIQHISGSHRPVAAALGSSD